jgi:DNA sulfur modification protein DndD
MILKKLTLNNFRQYLGRQEVIFAAQRQNNVTLIHGENGFGKTCFLNALLWGFYGLKGLTEELEEKEHIIPVPIRVNSTNPTEEFSSIEIIFEHGDREYSLARSISLAQEQARLGEETALELNVKSSDGQSHPYSGRDAQKLIDSILPPDLRELFFFDGENINHLAMEANSEQVREAVRGLLGLKLIDTAIEDLKSPNVRGKINDDLKKNTDKETAALIEDANKKNDSLAEKKTLLSVCKDNQIKLKEDIKAINADLINNKSARELQKRRALIKEDLGILQNKYQDTEKRICDLIATDGYSILCTDLISNGEEIIQKLRSDNQIPARVMNDWIKDLLQSEICVCQDPLPKNSEKWKNVEKHLTKAGDAEFNRAVGDLDKAIGVIKGGYDRTTKSLELLVEEKFEIKRKIDKYEVELEEIKEKIGGKDDEDAKKLETELERMELRASELSREQGSLERDVENLISEIKILNSQIQEKKQKGEVANKAKAWLSRVDETIVLLENILQLESDDLRTELSREVKEIFSKVTLQDYQLQLTPEFKLKLTQQIKGLNGVSDEVVATGKGHRQVMSLVFIASLVSLAQRRNQVPTILKDLHGGNYPLVMDSPFGQLGDEFRAAIARCVPQLAPQSVILVSGSQYRGDVENELGLSGRIGKRYILRYHAPSKREDAADSIQLGNKKYVLFKKDETIHTEIVEI